MVEEGMGLACKKSMEMQWHEKWFKVLKDNFKALLKTISNPKACINRHKISYLEIMTICASNTGDSETTMNPEESVFGNCL